MRVGAFPVGIEAREFSRRARRTLRSGFVRKVRDSVPGVLMMGVDRLDYTKGITLRLDAFERFLIANPKWHGQVTYLQITPKSRSAIYEYAQMEREIDTAAGRINGTFGEVAWTPLRYVNRAYSRTALSGLYRLARVGLVTPLRDGMNLGAKEYVAIAATNKIWSFALGGTVPAATAAAAIPTESEFAGRVVSTDKVAMSAKIQSLGVIKPAEYTDEYVFQPMRIKVKAIQQSILRTAA